MKNIGFAQGLYETSSTQKEALGTLRIEPDGRKFRYAYNDSTEIACGVTTSMATLVANHINKSVAAAVAIGDTEVQVTVGATAVTADQYKDGYLQVNDGTGQGHQYLIDTNTACAASGNTIVTLCDPIRVALVASGTSEVSLIPNPWYKVVVQATTTTGAAGVTITVVPASHYYWSQTGGLGCVLSNGTDAVGSTQTAGATDGSADIQTDYAEIPIGYVIIGDNVTGEYKPIWLTID
jgi:hypothetical protein